MTRRTYWHLESLGRRPNDYDIASSRLLYYVDRGFEVKTPASAWYEKYQRGSPFQCSDWERFRDPRETTYTKYTEIQRDKEAFVDALLRHAEEARHDAGLSPEWMDTLAQVLPPLRYPSHGLQMISAYVAQMAPSGRIVIAGLFQTADEMRRVQRLAYRLRELKNVRRDFGEDARRAWQESPLWQGLREVIEKLLVTYDWGEAFVALNFVLKPRFDELLTTHFAELARSRGDDLLAGIFASLGEDCAWHREWSRALARVAMDDRPANMEPIAAWLDRWTPLARRAMAPLGELVGKDAAERTETTCHELLALAGLNPSHRS